MGIDGTKYDFVGWSRDYVNDGQYTLMTDDEKYPLEGSEPFGDTIFAPESGEPRDSSSAAIVACGLLEAAKYVDETEAAQWRTLARQMLASLAANYAVKPGTLGSGQLLHGTYSKKSPYNTCTPEGVDECTSWGDYFYMEALTRLTKDWEMYW